MGNVMVFFILAMFAVFFSCGVYMVAADYLSLPTFRASLAVLNVSKRDKRKKKNNEAIDRKSVV